MKIHKEHNIFESKVNSNVNLLVQAGIKKFPFPHLKYKCGMGTCGTCCVKIISGHKNLENPTWKEIKILKDKIKLGYRLSCQIRVLLNLEKLQ